MKPKSSIEPMGSHEQRYWRAKALAGELPLETQRAIDHDWYHTKDLNYETVVKKYLKKLSKLEQIIYTNEIQGE